MPTYAIGDLQGCYAELLELLERIKFNPKKDTLLFVGDLVNRGPASLECLRFVKSLGKSANAVLGNHDLHLLAVANDVRKPHKKDTLQEIIDAKDCDELLKWLRQRPLLIHDDKLAFTIIHAGLPPQWSLKQTRKLARYTEAMIQSQRFESFIQMMYGDEPSVWSDELNENDKHRFIINSLTRLRYCYSDGRLDMKTNSAPGNQEANLTPWYAMPERRTKKHSIIFGHWSTVTLGNEQDFTQYNVYPLDTGCLWGGALTALRLEDKKLFSVPSQQPKFHK